MNSKFVKLTLPLKLYRDGVETVKEFGYSNIQELTVEGLRNKIMELKRERAVIALEKLKGSAKPRPRLTQEQRDKIAREHTPERARQMTKMFGLEDVTIKDFLDDKD